MVINILERNKGMHDDIEHAIKGNTAAVLTLLEWLKANRGAATKEELEAVYNKISRTHLPAMEKRIVDAIKTGDDNAIISATTNLKVSTDQLEKVVEDNQPISG